MENLSLESVKSYYTRVCERVDQDLSKGKSIHGVHLAAMKKVLAEIEEEYEKQLPKIKKSKEEAERKRQAETRALEAQVAKKLAAVEEERQKMLKDSEKQKAAIQEEKEELAGRLNDLVAREVLLDTDRRKYFSSQLTKPGDIIQVDPEYGSNFGLRGCLAVVAGVTADGAPQCYLQERGSMTEMGRISWFTISPKMCIKVGTANWRYTPAMV